MRLLASFLLLTIRLPLTFELPVATRPVDPDMHWDPHELGNDAGISLDEMEDAMKLLEGGLDDPLFSDLPEPGSRHEAT
eukprot:5720783-Prymnesium_polylepis.1